MNVIIGRSSASDCYICIENLNIGNRDEIKLFQERNKEYRWGEPYIHTSSTFKTFVHDLLTLLKRIDDESKPTTLFTIQNLNTL